MSEASTQAEVQYVCIGQRTKILDKGGWRTRLSSFVNGSPKDNCPEIAFLYAWNHFQPLPLQHFCRLLKKKTSYHFLIIYLYYDL